MRPTELQAGFGLEQPKRQPEFHRQRLKNADYFQKYLRRHSALGNIAPMEYLKKKGRGSL